MSLRKELAYAAQRVKPHVPRRVRFVIRRAAVRPLRLAYRGSGVQCPVCDGSFRDFARLGRLCPGCGAAPRHRVIGLYLRERTNVFTEALRVLHFGPEPALLARFRRQPTLDYVPADLDPAPGVARVDMTDIHLPGEFDAIVASHVLEHIPDDRTAMHELYRVLRRGGWAVLVVPMYERTQEDDRITDPRGRFELFGQVDHVRKYGPDFADRLRDAGFTVTAEHYVKTLSEDEVARFGVLGSPTIVHFCRKT